MSDSIRLQLIEKVQARFQTITTTNGYKTNLGNNIKVWRTSVFLFQETPELTFQDVQESVNQFTAKIWQNDLKFEVLIACGQGENNQFDVAQQIRDCIADVTKACGVDTDGFEGRKWSGLAYDTDPGENEIMLDQAENIIGLGRLTFTIKYRTKMFDPYTAQ